MLESETYFAEMKGIDNLPVDLPFTDIEPFVLMKGIRDRRDISGEIPWRETLSPEDHLFPVERELSKRLLSACREYMPVEDFCLVVKALPLALSAHQSQYRDSEEPYSTHFLWIANQLASEKYRQDAVTIASALLHDTQEDTDLSFDTIKEMLGQQVADTVEALSISRARYQRKGLAREKGSMRIIRSLLDNPRVAIIKIFDRLHNMMTLEHKKKYSDRRRTIIETEQIYIPLAKRLGLYEVMEELDDLCLRKIDPTHDVFADFLNKAISMLYTRIIRREEVIETIPGIKERIDRGLMEVAYRLPVAHDVYRRLGGIEKLIKLTVADIHLNIDISVKAGGYPIEVDFLKQAVSLVTELKLAGFRLVGFDLDSLIDEYMHGLSDSLTVNFVREADGFRVKVHFFPDHVYKREQASITDLYYRRPIDADKIGFRYADKRLEYRNALAGHKLNFLRHRLQQIKESRPDISSRILTLLFEPRLPTGYIWVVGEDDQGEKMPLPIKEGTTAIGYAREIFSTTWQRTNAVYVNSKEVPWGYLLKPDDEIHVERGKKSNWDPAWIFCFGENDEEIKELIRSKIVKIIKYEEKKGRVDMLLKVINIGRVIVEQYLGEPLRISLDRALPTIRKGLGKVDMEDKEITEAEFLKRVGLAEIDDPLLFKKIAKVLRKPNRSIGHFRLFFNRDAPGQFAAIFSAIAQLRGKRVNILNIGSDVYGKEVPSVIRFDIDPHDVARARAIINILVTTLSREDLGFKFVEFTRPETTIISFAKSS